MSEENNVNTGPAGEDSSNFQPLIDTNQAGTLYAVLDRLREAGLIEVDREEVVQSRLRRYYKLTGLGARRLAEETVRLRRNVTVAGQRLRKLGLSGGAA